MQNYDAKRGERNSTIMSVYNTSAPQLIPFLNGELPEVGRLLALRNGGPPAKVPEVKVEELIGVEGPAVVKVPKDSSLFPSSCMYIVTCTYICMYMYIAWICS